MRHLLFFIGLLTTASTGQENAAQNGPILLPQVPPKKVVEPVQTGVNAAATVPAATPAEAVSPYIEDLQNNYVFLQYINQATQNHRVEIKRGEIKAQLKILAKVPANLFGREFNFTGSFDQKGGVVTIEDKETGLAIAIVNFENMKFKDVQVDETNRQKLISTAPSLVPGNMSAPDKMLRLVAVNRYMIGSQGYNSIEQEGEVEYLAMDLFTGNNVNTRRREHFSMHSPQVGKSVMYHSIIFSDKATRAPYGAIGWFYNTAEPYDLIDLVTSAGPKANHQDVVNGYIKRHPAK